MALLSRTFFRSCTAFTRGFHASPSTLKDNELDRFLFKLDGYCKYGLLYDDLAFLNNPDIEEAVRRLPEEVQMQRKYRSIRAIQADINNCILPKEQWTKFEDDHHYLQPYIEEVMRERQEREEWEATH